MISTKLVCRSWLHNGFSCFLPSFFYFFPAETLSYSLDSCDLFLSIILSMRFLEGSCAGVELSSKLSLCLVCSKTLVFSLRSSRKFAGYPAVKRSTFSSGKLSSLSFPSLLSLSDKYPSFSLSDE